MPPARAASLARQSTLAGHSKLLHLPQAARLDRSQFKIEIAEDLKYAEGRLHSLNFAKASARLAYDYAGLGEPQMALQTTGEIIVEADRETTFKFIEVPEQLARCIPGCRDLQQTAPTSFTAVLTQEVSFMTLNFQVLVEVVKINPPHEIEAKFTGRPIGFSGQLAGKAELHLADAGPGRTIIHHSSDIGLTGKLGSLGQPVFRAKSAEMSAKFAANLKAAVEQNGAAKTARES